jgi:hypothetical protein
MPARWLEVLLKAVLLTLILVPFCTASDHWRDSDYEESHSEVRDFVSGGMVHVRLSVGDVQVRRSNDNQIRVHYTVKSRHESYVKDTRLDFEVRGNNANLDFHARGNNTSIDLELEVPQNTNLDVHGKVGDLTVEDIEGDKDLELGVGDIRIAHDSSGYRFVRASTGIGDVNADVGHDQNAEVSGWLGKTLRYSGEGKYELRAHVSVGDITLEGK